MQEPHVSASLGKCLWGTQRGTRKGPWGAWERCQPRKAWGVDGGKEGVWRSFTQSCAFVTAVQSEAVSVILRRVLPRDYSCTPFLPLTQGHHQPTSLDGSALSGHNPATWGLLRWSLRIWLEAPRVVASTWTHSVSVTCLQMIGLWVIPTVSPSWVTLLRTASCCLNSSLRVDTVSLLRGGYLGLALAPLLTPCLPFWVAANLFSKVETVRNFIIPSFISTGRVWGFLFPHTLPNTCSCLWDFSHPGVLAAEPWPLLLVGVASPSGWGFVFLTTGDSSETSVPAVHQLVSCYPLTNE